MKLATTIVGGLLVATTIGIGATLVYRMAADTPPLAASAPQNTVLYVEAPNLIAALEQFEKSPTHKDFTRSKSQEAMTKAWEELGEQAKKDKGPLKLLHKLGLEMNKDTALRFVGQGVAMGLTAPKEGTPAGYIVARMDVVGLAKDLAVGGKWQEVWSKLREELKGDDGKVEEYGSYQIVSRPMKKGKKRLVYYSQVDDLLIAATDREPVAGFIDVAEEKAEGLASHTGWSAVGALKDAPVAFAWVDPLFWRDGARVRSAILSFMKSDVDPGLAKAAEKFEKTITGKELDFFAKETKALEGFAAGIVLAEGGTYGMKLVASHDASDVFTSEEKPLDASAMAGKDPALFASCVRPYVEFSTFLESKGWKTLLATKAAEWITSKMDNPEELSGMFPSRGKKGGLEHDPRFEIRSYLAMCDLVYPELLGDRWAVGVSVHEGEVKKGELPFDGAAMIRLRPALRGIACVILGAIETHADKVKATVYESEGVKIFGMKPKPSTEVCFAMVGGDLVASVSKDRLVAAIKAGRSKATDSKLAKLLPDAPKDPDVLLYYDAKGFMKLMNQARKLQPGMEPSGDEKEMLEKMEKLQEGEMLLAFDVADDYTSASFHSAYTGYTGDLKGYVNALYPVGAKLDDAALANLPAETFAATVLTCDPQAAWKSLRTALGEKVLEQIEKGKKEVLGEENLDLDPETKILPHLGKTFGIGLRTQPKLPTKGAPAEAQANTIALPAILAFMTYESKNLEKNTVEFLEFMIGRIGALRAKQARSSLTSAMRTISTAQNLFKENDSDNNGKPDYARSLMDLAQAELIDWQLAMGQMDGYRIKFKRSIKEPEAKWMAVASPTNGLGIHYATNQDGQVVHAYKKIEVTKDMTLPEKALPISEDLGPEPEGFPTAKARVSLEKTTIGGKAAYRVKLDKKLKRQAGPSGEAFSPCFSFADGVLRVASSEHALTEALAAKSSLAKSPRFIRMRKHIASKGSAVGYFHWGGVIDQVLFNGEMLAREAAPTPSSMKIPASPDYPMVDMKEGEDPKAAMKKQEVAMKDFEVKQKAWMKTMRDMRKKQKEWRKTNAKKNAAKLKEVLGSLRVLGGMIGEGWAEEDKVHSKAVMTLDPEAK
jgi:hypothetical protein